MTASKNHYTAEFKEEAVRLVISSQKSCAEIARNLGVPPYLVVRWKQHHEQQGAVGRPQFTGRGVAALSEQEARFKKLERELEITRQERDILKKALAFFAKDHSFTGLLSSIVMSTALSGCARRSVSGSVAILRGGEGPKTAIRWKTSL